MAKRLFKSVSQSLHAVNLKGLRGFGVNKQREISRLIHEISKRESVPASRILAQHKQKGFYGLKEALLKRRYPFTFGKVGVSRFYLPRYQPDKSLAVERMRDGGRISPRNVIVESDAKESALAKRFQLLFPKARFSVIPSLKAYLSGRSFDLKGYAVRKDTFFLVKERFDYVKPCPCTRGAFCCGYQVAGVGFGCIYDCAYCFLQEYQNVPGIILPVNPEDFFTRIKLPPAAHGMMPYRRLGSGEFSDSLALDKITGYSRIIMDKMRQYPKACFEFKTKSSEVDTLIESGPLENIVVSWSLNPQKIIDENEWYTASLRQRIAAAGRCIKAGFKVGFHFDPLIYHADWKKEYQQVVELVFNVIPKSSIAWISLGTLRFNPGLKKIMELRFPRNRLLDEELLLGFDGKLRYHDSIRILMYNSLSKMIRQRSGDTLLYLCMEPKEIWKQVSLYQTHPSLSATRHI